MKSFEDGLLVRGFNCSRPGVYVYSGNEFEGELACYRVVCVLSSQGKWQMSVDLLTHELCSKEGMRLFKDETLRVAAIADGIQRLGVRAKVEVVDWMDPERDDSIPSVFEKPRRHDE